MNTSPRVGRVATILVFLACIAYAVLAGYGTFEAGYGVTFFAPYQGRLHVTLLFLLVALIDAASIVWVTMSGVRVVRGRMAITRFIFMVLCLAVIEVGVTWAMLIVGLLAVGGLPYVPGDLD